MHSYCCARYTYVRAYKIYYYIMCYCDVRTMYRHRNIMWFAYPTIMVRHKEMGTVTSCMSLKLNEELPSVVPSSSLSSPSVSTPVFSLKSRISICETHNVGENDTVRKDAGCTVRMERVVGIEALLRRLHPTTPSFRHHGDTPRSYEAIEVHVSSSAGCVPGRGSWCDMVARRTRIPRPVVKD